MFGIFGINIQKHMFLEVLNLMFLNYIISEKLSPHERRFQCNGWGVDQAKSFEIFKYEMMALEHRWAKYIMLEGELKLQITLKKKKKKNKNIKSMHVCL